VISTGELCIDLKIAGTNSWEESGG
jgi:hypothetical protein